MRNAKLSPGNFTNRFVLLAFVFSILGSVLLIGCGGSKPATDTPAAPTSAEKTDAILKETQNEKNPDKR